MKNVTIPETIKNISDVKDIDSNTESISFEGYSINIDEEKNPMENLTSRCKIYVKSSKMQLSLMEYIGNATIIIQEDDRDNVNVEEESGVIMDEKENVLYYEDPDGVRYHLNESNGTLSIYYKPRVLRSDYRTANNLIIRHNRVPVTNIEENVIQYDSDQVVEIFRRRLRSALRKSEDQKESERIQKLLDDDVAIYQDDDFQNYEKNLLQIMGIQSISIEPNTNTLQSDAYNSRAYLKSVRLKWTPPSSSNEVLQLGENLFKGTHPDFTLLIDDQSTYEEVLKNRDKYVDQTASIEYYQVVGGLKTVTEPASYTQTIYKDAKVISSRYTITRLNSTPIGGYLDYYWGGTLVVGSPEWYDCHKDHADDVTKSSHFHPDFSNRISINTDHPEESTQNLNTDVSRNPYVYQSIGYDIDVNLGEATARPIIKEIQFQEVEESYVYSQTNTKEKYSVNWDLLPSGVGQDPLSVINGIDYSTIKVTCTDEYYHRIDPLILITQSSTLEEYSFPHSIKIDEKEYIVTKVQGEYVDKALGNFSGFVRKITLPSTITHIEDYTFEGCDQLETVIMSKQIQTIGKHAFYNCPKLITIDLPSTLKELGEGCFVNTGIQEVILPESIHDFSSQIFGSSIQKITILSKQVSKISNTFFMSMKSSVIFLFASEDVLKEFNKNDYFYNTFSRNSILLSDIMKDEDQVFGYSLYTQEKETSAKIISILDTKYRDTVIKIPISVVGSDGKSYLVRSIGSSTFQYHRSVESVELPDSILEIEENTFQNLGSLKEIKVSSGLKSIPNNFLVDSPIETIQIPSSVQKIGITPFNLKYLKKITFEVDPYPEKSETSMDVYYETWLVNHKDILNWIREEKLNDTKQEIDTIVRFSDINIGKYYDGTSEITGNIDGIYWDDLGLHYELVSLPGKVACYKVTDAKIINPSQSHTIVIPEEVYNSIDQRYYTVKYIDSDAFQRITENFELDVHAEIPNIEEDFLRSNPYVTVVRYHQEIESIGDDAFSDCDQLMFVLIPGDNGDIDLGENIPTEKIIYAVDGYEEDPSKYSIKSNYEYDDSIYGLHYIQKGNGVYISSWKNPGNINVIVIPPSITIKDTTYPVKSISSSEYLFRKRIENIRLDLSNVPSLSIPEGAFVGSNNIYVTLPQELYDTLYQQNRITTSWFIYQYIDNSAYIEKIIPKTTNVLQGSQNRIYFDSNTGLTFILVKKSSRYHLSENYAIIQKWTISNQIDPITLVIPKTIQISDMSYLVVQLDQHVFQESKPIKTLTLDLSQTDPCFTVEHGAFRGISNLVLKLDEDRIQSLLSQGIILLRDGSYYYEGEIPILNPKDTTEEHHEETTPTLGSVREIHSFGDLSESTISNSGKNVEFTLEEEKK